MDTNISILQYIKGGEVSVVNEISNIKSDKNINIRVKQFFMNSPDYQKIEQEIDRKENQLADETNLSRVPHLKNEINNLKKIRKEFKIDVLHLADVFSKLGIQTERLKKARDLFDQGRFKEADKVLVESELSNDQFNLLIQVEYLEKRRDSFLN